MSAAEVMTADGVVSKFDIPVVEITTTGTCFGCATVTDRVQAFIKFAEDMTPFRVWFVWCGQRSCMSIICEANI